MQKETYKRLLLGLLWNLFCLIIIKTNFLIFSKNITNEFLNLPFNNYKTINKIYIISCSNEIIHTSLLIIYTILYPIVLYFPFVYLLLKENVDDFDKIFFPIIITSLISLLFYSVIYVEPPREVYNLNTYPFDKYISFIKNSKFVFPSLHVALPLTIVFSIPKKYKKFLIFILFSTILISISTILLLMHWIYDILLAIIVAYISSSISIKYQKSLKRIYNCINLDSKILRILVILTFLANIAIIFARLLKII